MPNANQYIVEQFHMDNATTLANLNVLFTSTLTPNKAQIRMITNDLLTHYLELPGACHLENAHQAALRFFEAVDSDDVNDSLLDFYKLFQTWSAATP